MTDRIDPKDFRHILYSVEDHIITITINRPERRNALNPRAYDEMEWAFRAAQADRDARVVIVTAADPTFCSGEDVREMMTGDGASVVVPPDVRPPATPLALAALACDHPVIAAINGAAVGYGMEIILFADIRIASEKAKFAELFIKRGLIADLCGVWRLPAIVGPSKAAELLFTGDIIDAAEAERIGLVSRVVPHEELMNEARAMAARIAVNAPLALRWMKEGLRRSTYGDPAEIGSWTFQTINRLMETADHKEGVASFFEKRAPVFQGK